MFGLLTKLFGNGSFTEESTIEILGQEFAKTLLSEKQNLQLYDSFESFFNKCHLANDLFTFNDQRFYFSNEVNSLPPFDTILKDQSEYKKNKGKKIENYFWNEKEVLFKKENKALKQHKRISIYHQILTSAFNYFPLEQKKKI